MPGQGDWSAIDGGGYQGVKLVAKAPADPTRVIVENAPSPHFTTLGWGERSCGLVV